jgi:hypothetical protein
MLPVDSVQFLPGGGKIMGASHVLFSREDLRASISSKPASKNK